MQPYRILDMPMSMFWLIVISISEYIKLDTSQMSNILVEIHKNLNSNF